MCAMYNVQRFPNSPSELLTAEENHLLFQMIGRRRQSLAVGIVELYCTKLPNHNQWHRQDCGVLCFIKDSMHKTYYFRIYCLCREKMIWEHEIYIGLEYKQPLPFLHTFEGEHCMVAFNFSSEREARAFYELTLERISRKTRLDQTAEVGSRDKQICQGPNDVQFGNTQQASPKHVNRQFRLTFRKKKNKGKKFTKEEIGLPSNYQHLVHIGWNAETGFDLTNADDVLKSFFTKAGISKKHIRDRESKMIISNFVAEHRDEIYREVSQCNDTPAIASPKLQYATRNSGEKLTEMGSFRSQTAAISPVPPSGARSPPAATGPSPPPPPPLPARMSKEFTQEQYEPSHDQADKGHDEANRGHVIENNPHADLMSEIRKGFKLKQAEQKQQDERPVLTLKGPENNLASALSKALAERSKVLHSDNEGDSSNGNDSNDDEWDC